MSSGRRGRGGGDRGGRGSRGAGGNPFRGGSTRGKVNLYEAPKGPGPMRDTQQDSSRGSATRGGFNARGDRQDGRNGFRGRGTNKTTPSPAFASSDRMNSTPFPAHEYQKRLEYLRDDRPRVRAELIKNRFMDPDGQMNLNDRVEKYGQCTDMCPEFERMRRIVEMDYKAPECTPETARLRRNERVPDESRMIKAFSRPAAGQDNELISDVRTPETCLETLKYMWRRFDEDGMDFLHLFVWDRSRAVRKDLTLGALKPGQGPTYLACIEQCARYHIVALHQMARGTSASYDHAIHHGNDIEQLRNCYTSLKHRYGMLDDPAGAPNRPEFVAYDIILSLLFDNILLEYNLGKLASYFHNNGRVMTAIAIYNAGRTAKSTEAATFSTKQQNWFKFWRLVQSPSVSYIMACAAELSFNNIRHHILDTLRIVYRPRGNRQRAPDDWTLEKLVPLLGFDNQEQVKEFCLVYGLEFGINSQGAEFLDTNSFPQNGKLAKPPLLREQYFSETIVESKRYGRQFSAIIEGMSVHEARIKGLVASELNTGTEEFEKENQEQDENSLFIPESSKQNIPLSDRLARHYTSDSTQNKTENPKLNPFAPTFQPGSTNANPFMANTNLPAAKPNPFASASQNGPNTPASQSPTMTPGVTPATIRPGLFDASKNSIKFASSTTVATTPFSTAESKNPFSNGVSTSLSTSNPFATATTSANPFATTATSSQSRLGEPTSQSSTPFSFANLAPSGEKLEKPAGSPAPIHQALSTSTFEPASRAGFSFQTLPEAKSLTQEEERRKVEEQQRITDEQRRVREEQERKAREEQERHAREEQQRRAQEAEQQRRIQEEQNRQRRIQEEEQRKIRAEQERQAHEEQLRRAQQEAERRAQEEHDRALSTLASNLLMDPDHGLMSQLLEHMITNMVKVTSEELREQRLEQLANEMYQQKRLAFTRAVCVRWVQQIEKKKKKAETRRRRQQIKALRAEAESVHESPTVETEAPVGQSNGVLNGFKKPKAPASVQRQNERPRYNKVIEPAYKVEKVSKRAKEATKMSGKKDMRASNGTNGTISAPKNGDYSTTYYKSTAPSDRTETDWFKLRAMGIDPSKHRKRSFGSVSSEDEVEPDVEPKRARRSTSSTFRRSLPPPSTDEERIARFRAVREALHNGGASSRPQGSNRSLNGNTSLLIARAHEFLADSPTPQHSPPLSMHREHSRSVSDLGFEKPSSRLSMFGRSIGAAAPNERPAYWGRTSRFVPQHLYGKGPDAVRAYRSQVYGHSPANSELLDLSSPAQSQQAYLPIGDTQHEYEESVLDQPTEDEADGEVEEGEDDDDLVIYDDDEYDEVDQDQGGFYEQEEEEYYDEDENGDSDMSEEPFDPYAQKPGGTQDDAIELSD